MKQILLIVQSPSDVAALAVATAEIKKLGTEGVWLVFSPSILTDTATASRQHDVAIRDIQESMKDCATRLDFKGADSYKEKLDAALLEKDESIKTAYTRMTKEEQDAAYARIFKGFTDNQPAKNIKVTQLSAHYESDNWIDLLASLKSTWFAPFATGSFSLAWPTSFPSTAKKAAVPVAATQPPSAQPEPVAQTPQAPTPTPPAAPVTPPVPRSAVVYEDAPAPATPPAAGATDENLRTNQTPEFKQIVAMGAEGMGREAIRLGINPNGMHRLKIAYAIYNKKYAVAA